MKRIAIIAIVISTFLPFKGLWAQSDTVLLKGRFTTSLYGFIISQQANSGNSSFTGSTNGFRIGTKSGVFIANKLATGLSLTLDRTETVNSVTKFDDEQVTIGIWLRWYFVNVKSVALYADINPYFVSVNQNLSSIDTNTINIESNGQGFGVSPGIGFVYFLNENVGFSLQVDYFLSAINATRTDRINNIIQEDNIRSDQLRFSFGFQLYLDEFFF